MIGRSSQVHAKTSSGPPLEMRSSSNWNSIPGNEGYKLFRFLSASALLSVVLLHGHVSLASLPFLVGATPRVETPQEGMKNCYLIYGREIRPRRAFRATNRRQNDECPWDRACFSQLGQQVAKSIYWGFVN